RVAVPVARRAIVEDAHVVGPGPPEARVEAESSRIRCRVAALREVLAVGEDTRVEPGARRRGTVGTKIADLANEIALLEAGLRVVAHGVAVDLLQDVLGRRVGPKSFLYYLAPRLLRVLDQIAHFAEDQVHDLAVGFRLPWRLHGGVPPLHHAARVRDGPVLLHEECGGQEDDFGGDGLRVRTRPLPERRGLGLPDLLDYERLELRHRVERQPEIGQRDRGILADDPEELQLPGESVLE